MPQTADYLSIPNLDKYQHYAKRRPPWIKLHVEILDDYEITNLSIECRYTLVALWMLASQMDNKIPYDINWLSGRLHIASKTLATCIPKLQSIASILLESDRGETETETENTLVGLAPGVDARNNGKPSFKQQASDVIEMLNAQVKKTFRAEHPDGSLTAGGAAVIALLQKGYDERDFRIVIARKVGQWGEDEKMHRYLTPETLFRPGNFAKYRGESAYRETPNGS